MRTRWKLDKGAAAMLAGVWFVAAFVVFIVGMVVFPRHSSWRMIAAAPILLFCATGCIAVLWNLRKDFGEVFGVDARFGWPWRREREPVVKDLREHE